MSSRDASPLRTHFALVLSLRLGDVYPDVVCVAHLAQHICYP